MEAGTEMPLDTAPPADAAPAEDEFQSTVLTLLQQMSATIQALDTRVAAVEAQPEPMLRQQTVERLSNPGEHSRRALSAHPDGIPHSDTIPIFPNGEKVPAMVMQQYAPKFGSGDIIQLNPNSVPHGREDGKTRGELMAEQGVPNGYGEVFDRTFLSARTGEWKYRVRFDKRVMPGSNGGLTALYESELLPA